MQTNQLPQGAKVLIYQGRDGLCYQVGAAQMPNGSLCACGTNPQWIPSKPDRYNRNTFAMVNASQAAQIAAQIAQGTSGLGNTFSRVDLPNRGDAGLSRREGNASPAAGNLVYTLILDNTLGATIARQFLGDYTGTYVLLGNTENTPAGFVVGGTWGTNSKTQWTARTEARPWRVSKMQFIASDETYYNLAQNYYFDTKPTANGPTKDNLMLTNLLSADQYNPKIQWYNESIRFDGVNGLDLQVPVGQKITIQFTIISEGSAGDQVLLT